MRSRRLPVLLLLIVALVFAALPVSGLRADDLLILNDGRRLKGTIIEKTRGYVKFRFLSNGMLHKFLLDDIEEIKRGPDVKKEFKERWNKAKKSGSAEGFYNLGVWIKKRLPERAEKCFKEALKINPAHSSSHRRLGHVKVDGKWVSKKSADKKPASGTSSGIPSHSSGVEKIPESVPEPEKKPKEPAESKDQLTGRDDPGTTDEKTEKNKRGIGQMALEPFKDDEEKNAWIEKVKAARSFLHCIETKHYFVFSQGDKKYAEYYGKLMDQMFKQWKKTFAFNDTLPRKLPIWLYRNQQAFMAAERMGSSTGGFFDGRRIVTFHRDGGRGITITPEDVLFHEGTHQFQALMIPDMLRIPDKIGTWLFEGLAVYFEPSKVVSRKKIVTNQVNRKRLASLKRSFSSVSIRRLITVRHARFRAPEYDQAWSLIYFFINYKEGKYCKKFIKYWLFIMKKKDNSIENFEKIIGPIDKIEPEWKAYVRALR